MEKAILVGYVENEDAAVRPAIIGGSDGAEALLAGRVPELEFYFEVLLFGGALCLDIWECTRACVDANSRISAHLSILTIDDSHEEGGFA